MVGRHFECLAGALWAKQGYSVYRTPGTKDYGVDVVAITSDLEQLVQAKSSAKDSDTLGWDAVKRVVAGEKY
jgi:HJR/Mrr/RecB family endonuclease